MWEEVNPDGVRVSSVYLGRTATPMQAEVHKWEGKPYAPERLIQPEQVAAVVIAALLLGPEAEITDLSIRPAIRLGTPENQTRRSPKNEPVSWATCRNTIVSSSEVAS